MISMTMMGELYPHQVSTADNFSYVDPVDGSKAAKQGIRVGEVLIKTTFNNYDFPDP